MLSVIMLSVIILCVIMLNVTYNSFVLSVFMLTGIMLTVMSPLPCSVPTQPKQLLGYLLLSIGSPLEQYDEKKTKPLLEYQHLLLLRDI
jgi:hypothetical protein